MNLEGEMILYEDIPGIVIHDDGDRLMVRFLGPEIKGSRWLETTSVRLLLEGDDS